MHHHGETLRHVSLLQGGKAYGVHLDTVPIPAKERSPRHPHDNFYFLQEDHLRDAADRAGFGWTILRPQVVYGESFASPMNLVPALGAYAAILRRRVIDRWRRAGHRVTLVGDGSLEVPVAAVDPTGSEFTDEVEQALSQLPIELRESLLLVAVGELTHQETADILGVPLGTVLSRVSRARERLRKHLLALSHA